MRFLCWFAALFTLSLSAQTYHLSTAARRGDNGDNQQATAAELLYPRGIAVARDGTVYVAQVGANRVRRIAPNGIITTYAGTGIAGFSGDGGPATAAQLSGPTGLALDQKGDLFILDSSNGRVRRVTPDGVIQTFAGKGGCAGNTNGPAVNLQICTLSGITVDPTGNLYLAEEDGAEEGTGHAIWKVDPSGNATAFAGSAAGVGALQAPTEIAWDAVGNNLYIYDLVYIYRRSPAGALDVIAGSFSGLDHVVTGVPAKGSYLVGVTSMTTDAQGNLYFSTGFGTAPSAVFVIQGGILNPVTGVNQANTSGFDGDDGTRLSQPGGMTFDANGNLYISDYNNHRVRRLAAGGALTTIAGSRTLPSGSTAPSFRLGSTQSIGLAPDGSLYFADFPYAQVRKIQPNGSVATVAGNGFTTPSGDGGPATSAGLGGSLNLIALDRLGNLDIHSFNTYRLRQVTPDGAIRTLAGNGVRTGPVGDVYAMAGDAMGTVYFSDSSMIRRTSGGLVTNVYPASSGSMAISPSGATYILGFQEVYRIDGDTLTRVAGTPNPKPGLVNDGLPATDAFLPFPKAIAFDPAGNLYISGQVTSQGPGAVWRIGSDGIQRRIAGPADGPESPDGTPAATAAFGLPYGISVDSSGNVFLATISEIKVLVPDTGSGCSIRLASNAADVPAAGGDSSVGVTASLYFCPYAIAAQATWIKPAVAGASGKSSVTFHIDPNTGAARQGTVTIGALTFTVRQPGAPLAISGATTLPAAIAGAGYSATLAATGGAQPYTWALASGTLPDGITLSAAGTLAGTPASAGTFAFTARVTDSAAASASQAFTLTVSTTVSIDAVVNAAGALTGPVAPGELVAVYGKGLGCDAGTRGHHRAVRRHRGPDHLHLAWAADRGGPVRRLQPAPAGSGQIQRRVERALHPYPRRRGARDLHRRFQRQGPGCRAE